MYPTPTTLSADYKKVYEPSEDSFLLLDTLENQKTFLNEKFKLPSVLEIGSGSGIVSSFLQRNIIPKATYLATDVNLHACRTTLVTSSENGGTHFMDVLRGSLADCLRIKIDVLIFNPPYVPDDNPVPQLPYHDDDDDSWLDFALVGGKDGMQITEILLRSLDSIMSEEGVAYILFCKSNKPHTVAEGMRSQGWNATLIEERRCSWEVLSVWRFDKES